MGKLFSGAEIVFKVLEHHKVEHIFGYPGGAVLPIYDELKYFLFSLFCHSFRVKPVPS